MGEHTDAYIHTFTPTPTCKHTHALVHTQVCTQICTHTHTMKKGEREEGRKKKEGGKEEAKFAEE